MLRRTALSPPGAWALPDLAARAEQADAAGELPRSIGGPATRALAAPA